MTECDFHFTSDDDCCTLSPIGDRLCIWLETADGDAIAEFTQEQFENLVTQANSLMKWSTER